MLDKKNYKIDITGCSQEEGIALQKKLFIQGYGWVVSGKTIILLIDKYLLLNVDMDIALCDESFFNKSKFITITVKDIMATTIPEPEPTITLRDQFAGQALASLITNPETSGTYENFAKIAYAYADAMLKERNK